MSPPHLTSKKKEQSGGGPPPQNQGNAGGNQSSMLEEQHDFKFECTMQTIDNNLDDANTDHQCDTNYVNLPCGKKIHAQDTTPSVSQVWLKKSPNNQLELDNQVGQRPRTAVNQKGQNVLSQPQENQYQHPKFNSQAQLNVVDKYSSSKYYHTTSANCHEMAGQQQRYNNNTNDARLNAHQGYSRATLSDQVYIPRSGHSCFSVKTTLENIKVSSPFKINTDGLMLDKRSLRPLTKCSHKTNTLCSPNSKQYHAIKDGANSSKGNIYVNNHRHLKQKPQICHKLQISDAKLFKDKPLLLAADATVSITNNIAQGATLQPVAKVQQRPVSSKRRTTTSQAIASLNGPINVQLHKNYARVNVKGPNPKMLYQNYGPPPDVKF